MFVCVCEECPADHLKGIKVAANVECWIMYFGSRITNFFLSLSAGCGRTGTILGIDIARSMLLSKVHTHYPTN